MNTETTAAAKLASKIAARSTERPPRLQQPEVTR